MFSKSWFSPAWTATLKKCRFNAINSSVSTPDLPYPTSNLSADCWLPILQNPYNYRVKEKYFPKTFRPFINAPGT